MIPNENMAAAVYSASITLNLALGSTQTINVTNGTAFTLNAPTGMAIGQQWVLEFKNTSGGAMGVVTFNAAFLNGGAGTVGTGALTQPATAKRRNIAFYWDGTNHVEISRSSADM